MELSDGVSRFELKIIGYESDLETIEDDEPDENDESGENDEPEPVWVVVRGVLSDADEALAFESASLDTEEARQLSTWMHGVAEGLIDADPVRELSPAHIFFCEPELQAWLVAREQETVTTRWCFNRAFVDITVTSEQFGLAASDWARNSAEFPDR